MRKTRTGKIWKPPTAADENLSAESAEDYRRRILGQGGELPNGTPVPTDVIKVKNVTGTPRRLGECLEVDIRGSLLTKLDPKHLWMSAGFPSTLARIGILKQQLPSNALGELQLSGVCKALVTIVDTTHRKCGPIINDPLLRSAGDGPFEIVSAPDATGEQECTINLTGAVSLPRPFCYAVGDVTITAFNTFYPIPFSDTELPAVSGGQVVYDPATMIWTVSGNSKWFHHLHGQLILNYPIPAGGKIAVSLWTQWNTAIPPNPATWTATAYPARWALNEYWPPLAYPDSRTHHQISTSPQLDGRAFRAVAYASGTPASCNIELQCLLNWSEVRNQ